MAQISSKFLKNSSVTTSKIADDAVDKDKIAADVAGSGLGQNVDGSLEVNAGDGIQISTDSVAVDSTVTRADGSVAFTSDQSMGGNKLTNLATPTADSDAVTKAYADALKNGLDLKDSVRAATTAAGTLATDFENGDLIDGVTLATGDRILIKNQATGSENGIYVVQATGAPVRALDADEDAEVTGGMFTFVEEGTTLADTGWVLSTNNPITVDTTSLSFVQFSAAGQIVAGAGLTKTGNTLDVGAGTGITVNADDVAIDFSTAYNDTKAVSAADLSANTTGKGASIIGIEDSGALITATTVEGALAENRTAIDALEDNTITGGDGITSTGTVGADDQSISVDLKTSGGLKIDTGQIAVEPADFAGAGLSDDGSDNLQVNVDSATTKINGSDQVESLKHIVEVLTLNGTDITNESVTLSQSPYNNQVSVSVDGVVQLEGTDYSVSGTSLRFGDAADAGLTASDLDPTSGAAALVSGDKIQVSYMYL